MVAGKYDTCIIVCGKRGVLQRLVVGVIESSVDIHGDGTLDRHVWCTHDAIERTTSLSSSCTDTRVVARLDGDAETLLLVRHGFFHGFHVGKCTRRSVSTIV